jgi:hypothetical protein
MALWGVLWQQLVRVEWEVGCGMSSCGTNKSEESRDESREPENPPSPCPLPVGEGAARKCQGAVCDHASTEVPIWRCNAYAGRPQGLAPNRRIGCIRVRTAGGMCVGDLQLTILPTAIVRPNRADACSWAGFR